MAIYKEDIVDIELESGTIYRSFMNKSIGEGDSLANRFGVRLLRNGEPVNLAGCVCAGYFIRSAGDTVVIPGTVNGNTAYVDLPQECYAYEGQFSLAIRVAGDGNVTGTMRIVDGIVANTMTNVLIDPGTIIPSVEDLIEEIETAVASIPAGYESMWTTFAPEFSSSASYAPGQYVTYNGALYRFKASHSGTWSASDVDAADVGTGLFGSINYRGGINSTYDTDLITQPGIYYASTSDSLPLHWPSSTIGLLVVNATTAANNSGTVQMAVDYNNKIFIRYKRSSAWTAWTEVSNKTDFYGVPSWNLIDDNPFTVSVVRDVTCRKTSSGTYHISGTKSEGSALTRFVLCGDLSTVPNGFEKGKEYDVYVSGVNTYVWISAYFNDSATGSVSLFKSNVPLNGDQNGEFTIPEDCTGMSVTIRFDEAATFDEDVLIYIVEKEPVNKRKAITDALVMPSGQTINDIPNIIASYPFARQTVNDVTGIKTGDNTFYVSGTKGSATWTTLTIYRSHTVMPEGFEVGKTYSIYLDSYDVSFWVVKYDGDEDESGTAIYKSENNKHGDQFGTFTIPETGVQGLSLTLKCENAASFDETVTVIIAEVKTNAERSFITSINSSSNANNVRRLFSVGNSFLTGSVYQNYERLYECTYKDAIYGQIARALDVTEENTVNLFHASTGFLSASQWFSPHLDVIESTDLSKYDYLLTHFNGADLYNKPLGTVNDAPGRSTLAAGVAELVEYVKDNYGLCKIIILGTPPYNSNVAGPNVFISPQGTQGNSINDMDNLMYQLALKYHFIYVSWQDLEISYHYMDYCDYHEGDTGAIHANSPDVYRALGEYAATQIFAVSSPIAIGKLMNSIGG